MPSTKLRDGIVIVSPTAGDHVRDEQARENRATEAKAEQAIAAHKAQRKADSARITAEASTRVLDFMQGCEHLSRTCAHPRLAKQMADLGDAHKAVQAAEKQAAEKLNDPLPDAIAKAEKQLLKTLPACFQNADDARAFAARLPLTEARRESVMVGDAHTRRAKALTKTRHRFWEAAETVAVTVTQLPSDIAVAKVIETGKLLSEAGR